VFSTFDGASAPYALCGLITKSATGTTFGGTPPLSLKLRALLATSLTYAEP